MPVFVQRHSIATPPIVLNLTKEIINLNDQYCEAGGFADVYRCHCKSDGGVKEVAVKAFRFRFSVARHEGSKGKIARTMRRELGIWKRVNHPNIVPFLGITYGFGREGNASLVSLWMTHGTLYGFLENYKDHLTDAHRLRLLLDISNGLSYLHSFSSPQPIVHGDLSCTNILLDDNYTARLADFGFASAVGDMPEALAYLQKTTTGPGAVRWAAPEHFLVGDIKPTTKSDIYSLGNIIFLVLSGNFPWWEVRQDAAVMLRICQGHKPARPAYRPIQDAHWALIERCWTSVDERPPAEDVVSSLKGFFHSYPTPEPLCDFLRDIRPAFSDVFLSTDTVLTSSLLNEEDRRYGILNTR